MHKHTVSIVALAIAALLTLAHRPVAAQGSPPIPTGGGSFNTTPVDNTILTIPKFSKLSTIIGIEVATLRPAGPVLWATTRSIRPVVNRRYWWSGLVR
jgi:hypothetical protein